MQITGIEISSNVYHIYIHIANSMSTIDENEIYAFISTHLNKLFYSNNFFIRIQRKSVVEHNGGVAGTEIGGEERPGYVLENDCGGGCGVIDDGDFLDVGGVD
uniref:Uncharacterized protein n=1 Tax=Solanum lycopersicum TaxID=4081 RepID=A0A3Q7GDN2_SOLLC